MASRTCPSCRHRLSPFALECPVCGLALSRPALPRPLLFQASALQSGAGRDAQQQAISAPALGRVTPVVLDTPDVPEELPDLAWGAPAPVQIPPAAAPLVAGGADSFWPLAKIELMEALGLLGLNLILALSTWIQTGALSASYAELWRFLLPVHFVLSWAVFLVPLVLTGQSPLMGRFGLQLGTAQPERRLAFSLFHLLSLCLFPVSFISMVLTPSHRTLAELLTGQDIEQWGKGAAG